MEAQTQAIMSQTRMIGELTKAQKRLAEAMRERDEDDGSNPFSDLSERDDDTDHPQAL